jgi:hypothetical protein
MEFDPVSLVLGLLGSSVVAALVYAFANRNRTGAEAEKLEAEAADIITKSAMMMLARADVTEQKLLTEVRLLETKVEILTDVVRSLIKQLHDHALEPDLPPTFKEL